MVPRRCSKLILSLARSGGPVLSWAKAGYASVRPRPPKRRMISRRVHSPDLVLDCESRIKLIRSTGGSPKTPISGPSE